MRLLRVAFDFSNILYQPPDLQGQVWARDYPRHAQGPDSGIFLSLRPDGGISALLQHAWINMYLLNK